MADTEEPRCDAHDLFLFLERFRRQNCNHAHTELRWLAKQCAALSNSAMGIKSGDVSHAEQEQIREFRRNELRDEIKEMEKAANERKQELQSLLVGS